jgi:hypothetical protein
LIGALAATTAAAQQPSSSAGSGANGRNAVPPVATQSFGMALMSATVNADGSLDRGAGVTGATKLGTTGAYEVDFDRDVTTCSYVANAGGTGFDITALGFASAVKSKTNANAVVVLTGGTNGAFTDLPFQLIVFCAR